MTIKATIVFNDFKDEEHRIWIHQTFDDRPRVGEFILLNNDNNDICCIQSIMNGPPDKVYLLVRLLNTPPSEIQHLLDQIKASELNNDDETELK